MSYAFFDFLKYMFIHNRKNKTHYTTKKNIRTHIRLTHVSSYAMFTKGHAKRVLQVSEIFNQALAGCSDSFLIAIALLESYPKRF